MAFILASVCIYFSKCWAPLLHQGFEVFDAKLALVASLWGAFWCLFGAMGSSGTPLAPIDAKIDGMCTARGVHWEHLDDLLATL